MKFLSIMFIIAISLINSGMGQISAPAAKRIQLNPSVRIELALEKIQVKFANPIGEIDDNLTSFMQLLKIFDEFKAYDIKFLNTLLGKIEKHQTLSGEDLFDLRHTIIVYHKINQKILSFAKVYNFHRSKMAKTFASDEKDINLIKAHLIYLSGHLLALDHLDEVQNLLYDKESVFRRIVKTSLLDKISNPTGEDNTLEDFNKINKIITEKGENLKFLQQINLVSSIEKNLKENLINNPEALSLLETIIKNRSTAEIIGGKKDFGSDSYSFVDRLIEIGSDFTNSLSNIFGNIVGSIRWRKGYLYENKSAKELILQNLWPMDILVEKSPATLTDKLIPGHFGHVAVYLGSKEQLEIIDMWNHPDIIPYQEEILKGKVILEAVRSGVRLTTLDEFLNIDEVTVMSKVDGLSDPIMIMEEIARGMDQIGKEYDFNFDISTLNKIVCSELIYITFGNVQWPTAYRMGRPTITPDDVAEILFYKNTKFKVKNILFSEEKNRIELFNLDYVADKLDFEKRASDGSSVKNEKDETNSYWKKEIKCYIVEGEYKFNSEQPGRERICKTSYKEFEYEEDEI